LDQRLATIPQHHWVSKLLGYDFTIEYKPGRTNVVADALSRRDTPEALLHGISSPSFDLLDDIKHAAQADAELVALRDQIVAGTLADPWTVVDGLVLFQHRIYIPAHFPFLPAILTAVHDDNHEGIQRTLHRTLHRLELVWCARKTKRSSCTRVASFSPCQFLPQFGSTSAWILSKDCQKWRANL
jgi:hypothetical protein